MSTMISFEAWWVTVGFQADPNLEKSEQKAQVVKAAVKIDKDVFELNSYHDTFVWVTVRNING